MNDLISRRAAIDLFKKWQPRLATNVPAFGDALKNLPSADRQWEWIPVSERLPELNQYVLVTYKTTDEVQVCQYCDDGSKNPWYSLIDECRAWNNVVLAWMPLPKPWKGADDESKRD